MTRQMKSEDLKMYDMCAGLGSSSATLSGNKYFCKINKSLTQTPINVRLGPGQGQTA